MTASVSNELNEAEATDDVVAPPGSDDTQKAPGEPPGRPGDRARKAVTITLVLLVVGLAAFSGYLGWQNQNARDVKAAADAALQVATSYAVTLTSVDSNNLDANFNAVLEGSTGEFRDLYSRSSTKLRQLLIDHKATGHGVVVDSAVKSATENQVVIMLFVDQTVSNAEVPDPRIDRSRIVMTMQKIDGRWKASKVDIP